VPRKDVASEGEREEVGGEWLATDGEGNGAAEAGAHHVFAVGHGDLHVALGLYLEGRTCRCFLGDEVVGGARVQEGEQRRPAELDADLHGLYGADTSHGEEGDERGVRRSILLFVVHLLIVLCQVKKELTDAIVATIVLLVAVKAKAMAFLHLRLTLDSEGSWSSMDRWRRQSQLWSWPRQEAATWQALHGRGRCFEGHVLLTQLQLVSQTHDDDEGLWIVDLDIVAELGWRSAVNAWTRCTSVSIPTWGSSAPNQSLYSATVPVGLQAMSSPSGLEQMGGPKRRLRSSENRRHDGVPSSLWTWINHIWAPPSRL